jgi:hypothetical protein
LVIKHQPFGRDQFIAVTYNDFTPRCDKDLLAYGSLEQQRDHTASYLKVSVTQMRVLRPSRIVKTDPGATRSLLN